MPTENRSSNTEMVSDKLPPCADDVFKNGVSACLVGDVPKHAAETICQSLSAVTGWKIDWHYFGGRTHIKALAPAPQPHPDPVALPERKEVVEEWATPGGPYRAEGWNACLDEIAKLGPLYTHPVQGEPVAWLFESPEGLELVAGFTRDPITAKRFKDAGWTVEQAYTHTLPNEVERLHKAHIKALEACGELSEKQRDHWMAECKKRDAQLAELKEAFNDSQEDVVNRGKMLAERDALLRRVHQADALSHNCPLWKDIDAALSASAEPFDTGVNPAFYEVRGDSSGRPCYGPNEWGTECGKCAKCNADSTEPSAPVERDELPQFAGTVIAKLVRFRDCAEDGQGVDIGRNWFDTLVQLGLLNRVQRSPAMWEITCEGDALLESRAALERKPS